jgi:TPR repeat protein
MTILPSIRAMSWALRLLVVLVCVPSGLPAPVGAQAQSARCAGGAAPVCLRRGLELADSVLRAHPNEAVTGEIDDALDLLRQACAQGLGDGCYFAGRILPSTLPDTAGDDAIHDAHAASLRLFVQGCRAERPSGDSCNGAGNAFAFALGTEVDTDSALVYFGLGCGLRNATACFRDGYYQELRRELGPRAPEIAERRNRLACALGSPGGCGNVATYIENRLWRVPEDQRGSARFRRGLDSVRAGYAAACAGGQPFGCNHLARLLQPGGLASTQDADSARQYYTRACEGLREDTTRAVSLAEDAAAIPLGYGSACYNLGLLALAAHPPDSVTARRLITYGCQLFDASACVVLGHMNKQVQSSPEYYANIFLFATACVSDSGYGCDNLGWAFLHDSLLADPARAEAFYRRACELNDANGCNNLAFQIQGPFPQVRSASPSRVRDATRAYRRGCELGSYLACVNLAMLMDLRFGDTERAGRLYERTCANGSGRACWERMLVAHRQEDRAREGTFRTSACRLEALYCKRKLPPNLDAGASSDRGVVRPRASVRHALQERPISIGQPVSGSLEPTDAALDEDGSLYEEWTFRVERPDERIVVTLTSSDFDTMLSLGERRGGTFAEFTSDGASPRSAPGRRVSRIVAVLPHAGEYVIRVNTFGREESGRYSLRVEREPAR